MAIGGWSNVMQGALPSAACPCAASLGAVETIAGIPATTSHVECTAAEMAALGIPAGLVRYSVGIEDCRDLIDDLSAALAGR